MQALDIQFKLRKKGITQYSIAQEMGVSEAAVSHVILRKAVSDRIMRVIAQKIGHDHREVFPEYYFKPNRARN